MRNVKPKLAFTLVELLVTLSIFILAVLGVTALAKFGINYHNFVYNQAEIIEQMQKSITITIREIREMKQADSGAFAIAEAGNNQFIFYSDIDETAEVERIRYFREGECLKKGIIKPTGIPPRYYEANETISNVSCNVTNAIAESVFSYYSGYPAETTLLSAPIDLHRVKIIKLNLRISSTGLSPLPTSKIITEYVSPRNINREEE
ncbi:MAG: hypothetical protein FJZ04_02910 [Candidatus Moranbacteria bacterium]|nr:hypothetical protein [Candidatus Moranbacteria bacterium]